MATEKQRLADIEACGRYVAGRIGFRAATVEDVMAYMADFADKHTVDAVEVVRCKDCDYRVFDDVCKEYYCNCVYGMYGAIADNDFCSYGERRTDEKT